MLYNAGLEGAVIINKVRESEVGTGFDALHEEYVDMVKKGILDPAKVTRSALQNATSVAGTLLTTESVVFYRLKKKLRLCRQALLEWNDVRKTEIYAGVQKQEHRLFLSCNQGVFVLHYLSEYIGI